MEMTIRALGWATKVLWIILITTVITIAYSATQINIAFGEPTTAVSGETVTISMPVNIHNAGLFDLNRLNITTQINDQNGDMLAKNTTLAEVIRKGTDETATHIITLNVTKILTQYSYLLFKDTTLTTFEYIAFNYANALPLNAHTNLTTQWGAPLSKLALKQVTFQPFNITHLIANFELTFENHNQYISVTGTARMEIYDSNSLIGVGATSTDVQPNSSFDGQIGVPIRNTNISSFASLSNIKVCLTFETSSFSYGPVVVSFG
jgi:hypothetical protein